MQFDPKRTALLVIDAIDADDTVYKPDPAQDTYRQNVAEVVNLCHEAHLPVLFCNDAHIPGIDHELELWGDHGIAGKSHIFPEINVQDSDYIIPKRRYSGFFSTDLDLTLRELNIDTLITVGADTNICVLHTLADAFYRNYKTVLVSDATLTFLVGTQDQAIERAQKCYGSTIVNMKTLRELLKG